MTETKRRSPLFAIVVIVLVAALAVEAFLLLRPKPQRPAEARQAVALGKSQQVETFGDLAAPIQIKFYAPLVLEWHQKTIGLLRQYNEHHPGRIHVTLMPMGLEECDAEMDYGCAKILVNGDTDFTLPDGRAVTLEKRPNQSTSTYHSEDVITLLDQVANTDLEGGHSPHPNARRRGEIRIRCTKPT
jgi:hypothetical protein